MKQELNIKHIQVSIFEVSITLNFCICWNCSTSETKKKGSRNIIRKLMQGVSEGHQINDKMVIIMSSMSKIFVAEIIENGNVFCLSLQHCFFLTLPELFHILRTPFFLTFLHFINKSPPSDDWIWRRRTCTSYTYTRSLQKITRSRKDSLFEKTSFLQLMFFL